MRSNVIENERGDALLSALGAVVIGGALIIAALAYNDSFQHTSRVVYVRALQSSLETSMRFLAMQPYAYVCGQESVGNQLAGISSCRIAQGYFANLATTVAGAKCPAMLGANCGFQISAAFSTRVDAGVTIGQFTGKITYQGSEVNVRPADVAMDIPTEVLQSQVIDCSTYSDAATPIGSKPVFAGYNPDGTANCIAFPKCQTGYYMTGVDVPHVTTTCGSLVAQDNNIDCGYLGGQPKVNRVSWVNGVVHADCGQVDVPPPNN